MSDNWIVQNLENALETWNEKLAEIWQLITQSPEQFKGGTIWNVIVGIHGAVQAIGLALLVLFFVVGVMKTCGSFTELKRPEVAFKCFIRFVLAQAAEYGHSPEREAAYLTVHGLCHLMGYDHIEDEDKKKMRAMEEKILSAIGMTRDGETQTDVSDETLLEMARQAMLRSYSPYSGYPVGAALLCADGRVFQGCNIENASFGLTNCAERTAMFKAVSEGAREFTAIAIASRDAAPWPCGACRQVLNEFAPNIRVLVTWQGGTESATLPELLPHGFGPQQLTTKE